MGTSIIAGGGIRQLPYHFLGDKRGHSADRGVIIRWLRCLGEARAGFSSLQGRKEAGQDRAGHRCCSSPLFLLLLVRQEQLNCLRKLIPRVQILPSLGQSLRWGCGISCSTPRPFTNPSWGAKLLCREWCFSVGFQPTGRCLVWEERDMHHIFLRAGKGSPAPLSQSMCPTFSLHISRSCCRAMLMEAGMPL